MKNKILLICAAVFPIACGAPVEPTSTTAIAETAVEAVPARLETVSGASASANDAAILIDPSSGGKSVILGSTAEGGIEVYDASGQRIGTGSDRPSSFIDVRYNYSLGETAVALIVADDISSSELVAYRWDSEQQALVELSVPVQLNMEAEGLCLYQSHLSHKLYAFVLGSGIAQQWELVANDGRVTGRLTRTVPLGTGAAHCVASDRDGMLYFSQETVGVARLNAEPESEAEIEYIDLAEPHGRYAGDVKGIALFEQADGGYLIVSDADVSLLQVYDLESDKHVGTLSVAAGDGVDGVDEAESIAASSVAINAQFGQGLLVLGDDDNDGDNPNFKLVAWQDVAAKAGIETAGSYDPTTPVARAVATVSPSAQTEPVTTYGDAADDPAIWVHPTDPALSVVLGTQKKRGINVYDLQGNLLQSREDGRINNVDLRYGFMLGDAPVDIVTASNRTSKSISIWKMDPESRTLVDIAEGVIPTDMGDPYGQCMYKSPANGDYYVFINDTDGLLKQWRLRDAGNGRVAADPVREISVGSQTEGCAADDESGDLYVGEENAALWKYSAEPDGGETRTMVDSVENGNLTADIEGVAIYYGSNGDGYIVASNQGADNYLLYERQGDNRFIGHFHVIADEATGIDGASETDGLDVTSANLGPAFPHGMLVVQDGRNISPPDKQNFKLVPWERIAEAMGLDLSSGYDPREAH